MSVDEPIGPGRSGADEPAPWNITVGTSFPLLVALYLRDSSGMHEHHHLISEVGGRDALRIEWEAWWEHLLRTHHSHTQAPVILETAQFVGSPALHRIASAHRGAAYSWAEARVREHTQHQARHSGVLEAEVEAVVKARERAVRRRSRSFSLNVVVLPFAEPRAWYPEPELVLLSHHLVGDPPLLRSYLEPIVELLV